MKYLYVATVLSHICQFHLPYLKMLQGNGDIVHVAANDNLYLKNGLELKYTDQFFNIPFERSPFSPKNIKAYQLLKKVIDDNQYDVIICNTPVGGVCTRLGSIKTRKKGTKVYYIAHGFHFYKGASRKNWVMYYPIEKTMAHFCDAVITINKEDYEFAKKHFSGNVEHIHGVGVDSNRYHPADENQFKSLREIEGLSPDDFVIICTGELNQNKNQILLINAVEKLRNRIPELKVLLAGNGPLEDELKSTVKEKSLDSIISFLGYRTDLENVVPVTDLVVSCSYREGMPLNIIEAMLCKKTVIASKNRGHKELVDHGVTGYLVDTNDPDQLSKYIEEIYNNKKLAAQFGEAGYYKAAQYTVNSVEKEIKSILKIGQK